MDQAIPKQLRNKIWIPLLLIAFLVVVSLISYRFFFRAGRFTGKEKTIAVLPFVNLSGNPEHEYLNDGITDEIIMQLSKITDLRVISRPAVMTYKGSKKTIPEIAGRLHVAALLQGTVEKSRNSLNIIARLTDVKSGKVIWTGNYSREMKDIFFIQTEVARLIAEQLHAELTEDEKKDISRRPTQNLEAYNQFLQGRYYYYLKNAASLRKGIEYFNQAVQLDSGFSRAWSGLADCYAALGYGSYALPASVFLKAEKAAYKALELDSTLADPHTSLGYIRFYYYWDWKGAEEEFLKAIKLNPSYVLAYSSYAYYLTAMERMPEARRAMEQALQLDPLSASTATDMGFHLFYSRNYTEAEHVLNDALAINPKAAMAHIWLGRSLQAEEKYADAIGEYQKTLNINKNWPVAYAAIGYVQGITGEQAEAKKILEKMNSLVDSIYVTPYGLALVYASLHDTDQAFVCLDQAYKEHSNWLVWLKMDPRWTIISKEKRYEQLVAKMGLPTVTHPFNRN
jgi:TolB-like protein/Flp pilus assembly protein TadD